MNDDIKNLKEGFDSIEIPSEIDFVIESAMKRSKITKRKRIYKPIATIAACLIIFVLTVNVSPAFAGYLSKVPGLESIVRLVQFDKGLQRAAEEGMGQVIDKSVTDNGITFKVESLIFDGRSLVVAYEIKSDKKLQSLGAPRFELLDSKGKNLEVSMTTQSPQCVDTNTFKGLIEIGHEGYVYPEDIVISLISFDHIYDTPGNIKVETISGNWKVEVKLDKNLASVEPKYIELNKKFSVEDLKFTAEYIKIYPTVIDVKLIMDKNNPETVTAFNNLRLIDENGNEYRSNSASYNQDEYTAHFESSYFTNPREFTLAFDSVYTMPKEYKYLVIDIENGRVLEDGGYKVEFLRKNYYTSSMDGRKKLDVWFRINDEEYVNNPHKLLWINHDVTDEKGKVHNISFGQTSGDKGNEEYSLMIDIEEGTPKIVKVKIEGISKGIIKAVKVKLN